MASQTTETLGRPVDWLVEKWLAMAREEYLPENRIKVARKTAKWWKKNDDAQIQNRTSHSTINMAYISYLAVWKTSTKLNLKIANSV